MRQSNNQNEFKNAIDKIMTELNFSSPNQIWERAGVGTNKNYWNWRLDGTKPIREKDINKLVQGLKNVRNFTEKHAELLYSSTTTVKIIKQDTILNRLAELEHTKNPDPQHLLDSHFSSFVRETREAEIDDIINHIDELSLTGGYLAITGFAGEGKTSLIAKLIRDMYKQEETVYYFIPFNPGEDRQVPLLRSLMASLVLKHNYLSDLWLGSFHRSDLADSFTRMLEEISALGLQEIIFIDGLDQIRPDSPIEERDLDFLPRKLPKGIVIVIGSRPDGTVDLLGLQSNFTEYPLPHLSKQDFDKLLKSYKKQLQIDKEIIDRIYKKMGKNALYLNLVARELVKTKTITLEEIIKRVADDPNNIFSISIDRLKWHKDEWERVTKQVLGLLLVTQEPLKERSLQQILKVESDELRRGLRRLGGLVIKDVQGRYSLYHLKFHEYLREDDSKPGKEYVFNDLQEATYHKLLANWCEIDRDFELKDIWDKTSDLSEQERRRYAREHYITHLYRGKDWKRLFAVLDKGEYGKEKIVRYDPSMRLYAEDIKLGQLSMIHKDWGLQAGIENLPRLWKYSLLWHSMVFHADKYPNEAFEALVWLGQVQEAVGLAELLADPVKKIGVLTCIAKFLEQKIGKTVEAKRLLLRSGELVQSLASTKVKAHLLNEIIETLIKVGDKERARKLLEDAEVEARSIETNSEKFWFLCELVISQYKLLGRASAMQWIAEAREVVLSLQNDGQQSSILRKMAEVLAEIQEWDEAIQVAQSMKSNWEKVTTLRNIADMLVTAKENDQAMGLLKEAVVVAKSINRYFSSSKRPDDIVYIIFSSFKAHKDETEINTETYIMTISRLAVDFDRLGERRQSENLLEEVTKVVQKMNSSEAMAEVVVALIKVGEIEKANWLFAETKKIIHSELRTRDYLESKFISWGRIALALAECGRDAGAQRLLKQIRQWALFDSQITDNILSRGLKDVNITLSLVGDFALMIATIASAVCRDWDKAEKALDLMRNDDVTVFRTDTIKRIMEEYIIAGEEERGVKLVCSANGVSKIDKISILCDVAEKLMKLGKNKQILLTLTDAENIIRDLTEESRQDGEVLSEVVKAWGESGEWERAEALARTFTTSECQAMAFSKLAMVLAKSGGKRKALRLLVEAKRLSPHISHVAITTLAKTLAELKMWSKADKIARLIVGEYREFPPHALSETLKEIAIVTIKTENWERFDIIEQSLKERNYYGHVFVEISVTMAQAGAWERAEKSARSLEGDDKIVAMSRIAALLARSDQKKDAQRIIADIETLTFFSDYGFSQDPSIGEEALYDFSVALASVRDWEKAEMVTRFIEDFMDKCTALIQIAADMVIADEPFQALTLMQNCLLQSKGRNMVMTLLPMSMRLVLYNPIVAWMFYESVNDVEIFFKSLYI